MTRRNSTGTRTQIHCHKSRVSRPQQSEHSCSSKPPTLSVVDRSVLRSGLSYDSFVRLLIQSALSRLTIWTQADLDRLLLLSERLGLDPLNNEIYASEVTPENGKKSRIVFVVGVDGWSKIINSHPQFDGMKFVESAPGEDELPPYIECTIYRKDRRVPTSIREYMYEAHTNQGAWLTHPRRMLRHKAMVQCARACFGLGGLYEPDEAARITSNVPQRFKCSGSQTAANECENANQGSHVAVPKGQPKQHGNESVKKFIKENL
jgi:phage recombination protein Bet